ncbi:MAG: hypothetical protein WDZ49_07880 [Litorilinea sp.]
MNTQPAWWTRHARTVALWLAFAHFLLAATFSVLNPLGESPDEADHWAYSVYLATERALPVGPQVTQSKHPPAYHAGAALAATLGEPDATFLRANPDLSLTPAPAKSPNFFIHTGLESWPWRAGPLAFHLARLWTAFLSGAIVLAAYGLTRAALPGQIPLALLVAATVAAWPEVAFLGGAVNNDTPVALASTLALWGGFAIARAPGSFGSRLRAGWWTPLALGLGLLTKLSAAAVWPIVGLTLVAGCALPGLNLARLAPPRTLARTWARNLSTALWRTRAAWFGLCTAVFGLALLLALPWFWRNWQLYNDPLGLELARQTIDQRQTPWGWTETRWLLEGWFLSFWGKFGAVGHITYPAWTYIALAAVSALGLGGLLRIRQPRASTLPLLLLAGTVVAVALGIWRYSLIALGTDQGRLLFPALVPILILLLVGLRAWIPIPYRTRAGIAFALTLTGLTLYGLVGILRPAYAPPRLPAGVEIANIAPVTFGELTLVGYSLDSQPMLAWRAATTPTTDWRTILRVVAEDGTLVWEWRRSPGAGRWSTDRWPAGVIVPDLYAVQWPEWAGPGTYLVEVGVYPFDGAPIVPTSAADNPAPETAAEAASEADAHPYYFLGRITRAD